MLHQRLSGRADGQGQDEGDVPCHLTQGQVEEEKIKFHIFEKVAGAYKQKMYFEILPYYHLTQICR